MPAATLRSPDNIDIDGQNRETSVAAAAAA
jgi:hypothetical protein